MVHKVRCVPLMVIEIELTSAQIYAEVLTVIFSHPNVRRTVGQSGMLQRFKTVERKALNYAYLDAKMMVSPWPSSMMIQYDV